VYGGDGEVESSVSMGEKIKACFIAEVDLSIEVPQGLKPFIVVDVSARLKPCPPNKNSKK